MNVAPVTKWLMSAPLLLVNSMSIFSSHKKWLLSNKKDQFSDLSKLSFALAALVNLIGILVLFGWQFDLMVLKRPLPGLAAMNPLTAICFILCGTAFITLLWKDNPRAVRWGRGLCFLILAICVVQLLESVFNANWQLDQLIFGSRMKANPASHYSRMAINTAISFILFAIALIMLQTQVNRWVLAAHYLSLVILMFAFFQVLGYVYGAPEFYVLLSRLPMAIHTALCLILLSLALFFVFPGKGLIKEFTHEGSGRTIGIYLVAGAMFIPAVFGAIRIYTHRINLFSTALGITLLVISIIIVFTLLCLFFVIALNREDQLRRSSEEKLHESQEIFRSLVLSIKDYAIFRLDTEGHILTWNKGAENIKGYTEAEITGKHISVFYTKEDKVKNIPAHILHLATVNGQYEMEGWRVRKDGSLFWADVIMTALHDRDGVLNGFAKVTRDITESKRNKDLLSDFNRHLSQMVDEKTFELEKTTEQLRRLASYLQSAREEERKHLAREMHDELGQMLTGLRMDMVWLKKNAGVNDVLQARFDRALELLSETRQSMRRLATELHPAMLEDLGLTAALASYAREFENRFSIKINFSFDLDGFNDLDIAQDMTIAFYRIFQESLNNIAKHANATVVTAWLAVHDHEIILEITDNGVGFDVNILQQQKSLGLVSIRERTLMLNGQSEINSAPGKGTTIFIKAPLKLENP